MAEHEVNTETFNIEAGADEDALAQAQAIVDTKELEEGKYRLEIDPIKEYRVRLIQTVDGEAPADESTAE